MGAQGLLRVGRMNWLWDLKIWIENQSRTHPGFVRPWNGNRIFCSFETGNKLNVCWLLQRLGQQSMLSFHSSHQWTNPNDSNGFTQTPKMGSHHSFRYNRLHYHHPLKNDQWKRNTTIIGNWTTITKGVTHWDGTCWEQYMSYISLMVKQTFVWNMMYLSIIFPVLMLMRDTGGGGQDNPWIPIIFTNDL